jgi:16S rRNA (cytosine967-C5)-methyltransferase
VIAVSPEAAKEQLRPRLCTNGTKVRLKPSMPVSPARAVAFQILLRADRDQSYASELLHSDRNAALSPVDHGLATELVMGVLRWRSILDRQLSAASSQKLPRLDLEVLTALRLGVYQLQFLSRVPARAAIFESVEIVKAARKRSAASFVNAVLRRIGDTSTQHALGEIHDAPDAQSLARASAHPDWLVTRWAERYGLGTARQICLHNQTIPTTAIHVQDDDTAEELAQSGIELSLGLLLSAARRVESGDVTKSPAYREGRVFIQDEASQLVALLIGRGQKLLDCCAAPGSKTSLLAKQNPQARVFASDLHPHRAHLLRERIAAPNLRVLAADARHLPFGRGFDRILADVPCSGTGTLARNPEIKWRLTADDFLDLQMRQIAILKSALDALTPGGRLVYSTCSLEFEENELVVEAVLTETTEFKLLDCRSELEQLQRSGELVWKDLDSLQSGSYLRTLPGVHPCDGFFVGIIERRATS